MNTDYLSYPLKGAPVGNNKVYVIKEIELEHAKSLEDRNKMGYAESMAYFAERERQRAAMPLIVPKVLTSVATSPLTVDVAAGAESLKIEVDDYE